MILRLALLMVLVAQGPPARTGTQFGTITGRVLNQKGSPAAGIRIGALAAQNGVLAGTTSALMSISETDADGRYRLTDVPAGNYYITAGPLDGTTYFPGTSALLKATVVTVQAQSEMKGVDFALATAPLVRISGFVVREDDTAKTTAFPQQVRLGGNGPNLSALIAVDGSFEFQNVRPGTYQATILPTTLFMPPASVVVGDSDMTDLRLVIPLMVNVSGAVSVEDNGPLPRFQLSFSPDGVSETQAVVFAPDGTSSVQSPNASLLRLVRNAGLFAGGNPNVPQPAPAAPGAFTVPLPVGAYSVRAVGFPVGFSIKSMTADSTDLLKEALKVTAAGAPTVRVTLSISPEAWIRVSGRIVGSGAPGMTPNILIGGGIVKPLEPPSADVYLDGSFEFPRVLAGNYQILVAKPQGASTTPLAAMAGQQLQAVTVASEVSDVRIEAAYSPLAVRRSNSTPGAVAGARVTGRVVGRARWTGPASVALSSSALIEEITTQLNWDGSFEFVAVPPGTYAATVRPAIPGAKPTMITVERSTEPLNIEVRVPATRDVPGRLVVDGTALPIRSLSFSMDFSTPVQPDGSFRLMLGEGQTLQIAPGSLPVGYVVESIRYGAADIQMQPVAFNSPASTELRVSLSVTRAAAVKVSGRITGAVPPSSHVWLVAPSRSVGALEAAVEADGSFVFTNVAPGAYALRFGALGIPAITAIAALQVGAKDITGVQAPAPRMVSGQVLMQGGGLIPRFSVLLRSESGEGVLTINPQSQLDGTFRVALPIGVWQVAPITGLPAGAETVSITYGAVDLRTEPLRVTPTDSAEFTITLSR